MILIIGYGSAVRCDDGVGPYLARQLARENVDPNVHVEARHQLTLELAEPLSQSGYVVFIDASTALPPGHIGCRAVEPVAPTSEQAAAAMSHHCTPEYLLAAAHLLYGAAPPAVIISIGAESFAYTETFSPAVADALPSALDVAREFIATQSNLAASTPLGASTPLVGKSDCSIHSLSPGPTTSLV